MPLSAQVKIRLETAIFKRQNNTSLQSNNTATKLLSVLTITKAYNRIALLLCLHK